MGKGEDVIKSSKISRSAIQGLKDFSQELKEMGVYLSDYANWRQGRTKGAKGEPMVVLREMQSACMREATLTAEVPDDIFCFREDYKAWRQGRGKRCKISDVALNFFSV